jgi:hypothetical protein
LIQAPCVLGLPLFSSEVFDLGPLCFGVASFFIGGLWFEPMGEGCDIVPSCMALACLAYQLLSNMKLALLVISMTIGDILGEWKLVLMLRA